MFVKHNNIIINIDKYFNESNEEYNKRVIFILKNIESQYTLEDLINLSHIFKNKEVLKCSYPENLENIISQLSKNLYIT